MSSFTLTSEDRLGLASNKTTYRVVKQTQKQVPSIQDEKVRKQIQLMSYLEVISR